MPTLNGPRYEENFIDQDMLFRRFRYWRGITLGVKGTVVTEMTYPYLDIWYDGSFDHIYEGGHVCKISQAEADILIAAGYGQWITPD